MTQPNERASHPVLWTLAVIVIVAAGIGAYLVLGPKPTDFAGGKRVRSRTTTSRIRPVCQPN
jgi:hypothetical protein